jgi:hypothetical protein
VAFERKPVEQRVLLDLPLPHHRLPPSRRDARLYCVRHAVFQHNPRSLAVSARSGDGPLTEPTAAAQLWVWEPLFMPPRPSLATLIGFGWFGGNRPFGVHDTRRPRTQRSLPPMPRRLVEVGADQGMIGSKGNLQPFRE